MSLMSQMTLALLHYVRICQVRICNVNSEHLKKARVDGRF